jgi:tRNA G10  N-methylase Trm11
MNDPGNSPIPLSPVPGPPGLGAPLSVWAATPVTEAAQAVTAFSRRAQQDARTQCRGRYLPASTAHPAKMLPAIAATAIERYTRPGDLVIDPICGIGTTLVEGMHLGRDAAGVEYEARSAQVAAANIAHARPRGAAGRARVTCGDARSLPALLAGRAGKTALHLQGR